MSSECHIVCTGEIPGQIVCPFSPVLSVLVFCQPDTFQMFWTPVGKEQGTTFFACKMLWLCLLIAAFPKLVLSRCFRLQLPSPLPVLAGAEGSCSPATYEGHQVGRCWSILAGSHFPGSQAERKSSFPQPAACDPIKMPWIELHGQY